MKALNTIRHFKILIAVIFVASILAVTACDVLCSIDRSASLATHNMQAASHHNQDAKGHRHDHAVSYNHHAVKKDITSHTHSAASTDKDDDDCCKDITSQFYKSLFSSSDLVVKAPVKTFILFVVVNNYNALSVVHYINPFEVPPKIPPNSTGNHLRVMISSFLI